MAQPNHRYAIHIKGAVAVKVGRTESPVLGLEPGYIVFDAPDDNGAKELKNCLSAPFNADYKDHTDLGTESITNVIGVTVSASTHENDDSTGKISVQTAGVACVVLDKRYGDNDIKFGTPLYATIIALDKYGKKIARTAADGQKAIVCVATTDNNAHATATLIGYAQGYVPQTQTACVRLAFGRARAAKAAIAVAVAPKLYRNITGAFADTPAPAEILNTALKSLAAHSHNEHIECGFTQVSASSGALSAANAGVIVEGNDVHVASDSAGEYFFAVPTTSRKSAGKPSKVTSRIGGCRIGKAKSPWVNTKFTTEHVLKYQDFVRNAMLSRKPVPAEGFTAALSSILA